ncbi:MAG: hypothetical protein BAJALOKI1v1_590018 [Promethearchaeota archaeon]|nr:MAG: hypothetical protein BAJALOKI1v1_590018 [Candidatus Lokiarchaeota archaeon]
MKILVKDVIGYYIKDISQYRESDNIKKDKVNLDEKEEYGFAEGLVLRIIGQLESGKKLLILDYHQLDLRKYIGCWIECLLSVTELNEDFIEVLQGKYIKNYVVPSEERKKYIIPQYTTRDQFFYGLPAIQINNEILYIFEKDEVSDGEEIMIKVGRYNLVGYYLIEDCNRSR